MILTDCQVSSTGQEEAGRPGVDVAAILLEAHLEVVRPVVAQLLVPHSEDVDRLVERGAGRVHDRLECRDYLVMQDVTVHAFRAGLPWADRTDGRSTAPVNIAWQSVRSPVRDSCPAASGNVCRELPLETGAASLGGL